MPAELTGRTATQARISRQLQAVRFETVSALIEWAEALLGLAARYAPVDQGDLRGSFVLLINGQQWGHTEALGDDVRFIRDRTDVPQNVSELQIYVGTAGCVYALRQHEEIAWNHPKGGFAKYLEKAYNELIGMLPGQLEDAKQRGLQKGG